MTTLTGKQVFFTLQQLPENERQHFFALLSGVLDNKENLTHRELFGHLESATFTALEAAEYLDISVTTFRRYLKAKKIEVRMEADSTHLYSLNSLRKLKKSLKLTKSV